MLKALSEGSPLYFQKHVLNTSSTVMRYPGIIGSGTATRRTSGLFPSSPVCHRADPRAPESVNRPGVGDSWARGAGSKVSSWSGLLGRGASFRSTAARRSPSSRLEPLRSSDRHAKLVSVSSDCAAACSGQNKAPREHLRMALDRRSPIRPNPVGPLRAPGSLPVLG
jgi:hypothetical protein